MTPHSHIKCAVWWPAIARALSLQLDHLSSRLLYTSLSLHCFTVDSYQVKLHRWLQSPVASIQITERPTLFSVGLSLSSGVSAELGGFCSKVAFSIDSLMDVSVHTRIFLICVVYCKCCSIMFSLLRLLFLVASLSLLTYLSVWFLLFCGRMVLFLFDIWDCGGEITCVHYHSVSYSIRIISFPFWLLKVELHIS